ncbi:uncharacterized protein CMU_036710 [Cryptosporidium muris RN66]|uniref:Uncharacterized protein n=1 Tax=Cryptosporidium muris (strain RN66) TaxID=441375 RepID=B6AH06_CRYMR|nr:uncharacterized protein CMU_036710 [Cryptosporidium muris RN66]EEA07497.1 hypothetical protein, conserved [Cryptosporidium muris RN66]|eukprot:XP_002141846.1 hypothetical protein [Cryptosporidium muris RN66]
MLFDSTLGYIGYTRNNDINSQEQCRRICNNGLVYSTYKPPEEPVCGSYISCKKCNFEILERKSDPSAVCYHIFTNNFVDNERETTITLFYGKSQKVLAHSSKKSRLTKSENVVNNKRKGSEGLFSVLVDWHQVNGVNASMCSNGIAEIEWTLYNIGVYRNWDFTALLETTPESTFPMCYENLEESLDRTRRHDFGRKIPTNMKRLGYSLTGRPNAIRLSKIIAVNQPEMKKNPEKAMKTLLKNHIGFKIVAQNISVKDIYSESFYDTSEGQNTGSRSKYSEISFSTKSGSNHIYLSSNNEVASCYTEVTDNISETDINTSELAKKGHICEIKKSDGSNKNKKKHPFTEKIVDLIRGRAYTEPLILDSLLSLGYYSCFRVTCTKRRISRNDVEIRLPNKIILPLDIAKSIHEKVLRRESYLLPPGYTVPLLIVDSKYWNLNDIPCQDIIKTRKDLDIKYQIMDNSTYETDSGSLSTNSSVLSPLDEFESHKEEPESQIISLLSGSSEDDWSELLTMIALTDSSTLDNKDLMAKIFKGDPLVNFNNTSN